MQNRLILNFKRNRSAYQNPFSSTTNEGQSHVRDYQTMKTPIPKRPSIAAFTAGPVQNVLYEAKREGIDFFSHAASADPSSSMAERPTQRHESVYNSASISFPMPSQWFPLYKNRSSLLLTEIAGILCFSSDCRDVSLQHKQKLRC